MATMLGECGRTGDAAPDIRGRRTASPTPSMRDASSRGAASLDLARPLVLGRGRGGAARHRDFFWARDRCRASTAARNFTRHGRALAAPVPLHRTRPLHGSKHDRPAAPPRGAECASRAPLRARPAPHAVHCTHRRGLFALNGLDLARRDASTAIAGDLHAAAHHRGGALQLDELRGHQALGHTRRIGHDVVCAREWLASEWQARREMLAGGSVWIDEHALCVSWM